MQDACGAAGAGRFDGRGANLWLRGRVVLPSFRNVSRNARQLRDCDGQRRRRPLLRGGPTKYRPITPPPRLTIPWMRSIRIHIHGGFDPWMLLLDIIVRPCVQVEPELFRAIPWSHGTLGFLVSAEIEIIPSKVRTRTRTRKHARAHAHAHAIFRPARSPPRPSHPNRSTNRSTSMTLLDQAMLLRCFRLAALDPIGLYAVQEQSRLPQAFRASLRRQGKARPSSFAMSSACLRLPCRRPTTCPSSFAMSLGGRIAKSSESRRGPSGLCAQALTAHTGPSLPIEC